MFIFSLFGYCLAMKYIIIIENRITVTYTISAASRLLTEKRDGPIGEYSVHGYYNTQVCAIIILL